MDDRDKRLLNVIQADFPLASRPFQALGAALALSEGEVIDRIASLKQQKVVRQISAIFDTRSLGYKSSLVAMRVPPDRLDAAAAVVNSHPGVSHNYKRNHAFNLWFTLAVPPSSDLTWTVERLHAMAGAESTRILPTLRLFKIGVQLDMEGKSGAEREESREAGYSDVRRPAAGPAGLRGVDIAAIRELQADFPLVPEPYRPMADRMGLSEESLFEVARHLQGQGYLRRVAAVLHHREAGFRANAMGVWVVPPQRAEEVGKIMGSFRGVSHCYLRPTYPDWPYSIFTMVHGQKAKDCQEIIGAISAATDITEYALLYSTKEYKKVRLKYFTPELDEWEAHARQSAGAAPLDHGVLATKPR
ncbi:MAG: Lrp/AsnC family transcriptional regulator [candidate division NC10 bacterium]|nr:Lrp/AsnC family transcriptional regulator [candidate division NC10 bacterium]